jgi:hypothetical protein
MASIETRARLPSVMERSCCVIIMFEAVNALDLLEVDPVSGKRTTLAASVRRALHALNAAEIPYAVIGATALAVRGLPRMTRDLDVVVVTEDAYAALDALEEAGFKSVSPVDRAEEPEAMYILRRRSDEVDLLVAAGEPESSVVAEAKRAPRVRDERAGGVPRAPRPQAPLFESAASPRRRRTHRDGVHCRLGIRRALSGRRPPGNARRTARQGGAGAASSAASSATTAPKPVTEPPEPGSIAT